MLKFKLLNNQTAVEAKASDHHPIIMGDLCAFNMLCRCEIKTQYANNGFAINETVAAYGERLLNKVLLIIKELIEAYHVQMFALQEAPPLILSKEHCKNEQALFEVAQEFYSNLQAQFAHYVITPDLYKSMWHGSDACGLLIVHNKNYEIKKEITQEIVNDLSKMNQLRFQAFQYAKQNDKATALKLINLHADFNNQNGTEKDIQNLVAKGCMVAGDFNLKNFPPINNCFQNIQKTQPGLMPHDTYDGIIVKKTISE